MIMTTITKTITNIGKKITDEEFDVRIDPLIFEKIRNQILNINRISTKRNVRYYSNNKCIRIVEQGGKLIDQYRIVKMQLNNRSDEKQIIYQTREPVLIHDNSLLYDLILDQQIETFKFDSCCVNFIIESDISDQRANQIPSQIPSQIYRIEIVGEPVGECVEIIESALKNEKKIPRRNNKKKNG